MQGDVPANSHALSPQQRASVLGFLGYGNPAGRYWFIGLEERGVGTPEQLWSELLIRAEHFRQIEDLKQAMEHEAFGSTFKIDQQYVPTWAIMSKLVLRMDNDEHWQAASRAREYQALHLGRFGGETFLADLLPLPANNVGEWPYSELFVNREAYEAEVLSDRISAFRTLVVEHTPTFVFCYGRTRWESFQQIFAGLTDYEPIPDTDCEIGYDSSGICVVLTPFFRSERMGHTRIDRIVRRIREDRFTWRDGDVTIASPDTF